MSHLIDLSVEAEENNRQPIRESDLHAPGVREEESTS